MATERTRLFVEGVRTAITADVTRRRPHGLVVTQALPFLRLDTKVVGDDGRQARISRVAIAMDGDVPRLLLELANEDAEGLEAPVTAERGTKRSVRAISTNQRSEVTSGTAERGRRDEDTLVTFTPGVSAYAERPDSTSPYAYERRERATVVVSGRARPSLPWWERLIRKVTVFLAALTRPTPSLPPG